MSLCFVTSTLATELAALLPDSLSKISSHQVFWHFLVPCRGWGTLEGVTSWLIIGFLSHLWLLPPSPSWITIAIVWCILLCVMSYHCCRFLFFISTTLKFPEIDILEDMKYHI